jgi:hypothetical protein
MLRKTCASLIVILAAAAVLAGQGRFPANWTERV